MEQQAENRGWPEAEAYYEITKGKFYICFLRLQIRRESKKVRKNWNLKWKFIIKISKFKQFYSKKEEKQMYR